MDNQAIAIIKNLEEDPDLSKSFKEDKDNAKASGEAYSEMKSREIIAVIAYLQRLGTDIKVKDLE